jgi:dihydrofolate reductase
MRKIIVAAFVSLDGVMQSPGGPEEDPRDGFGLGGWIVPLLDEVTGGAVAKWFEEPYDLLLGRKTYDIFAGHWPFVETDPSSERYSAGDADISRKFNAVTKYVATHRPESLSGENTEALGPDPVGRLRQLKQADGPSLLTQGSSELVHQLLAHDMVDELRLMIFPVLLGKGRRLFDADSVPASLQLEQSVTSPNGGIVASYRRAGAVKTGSFLLASPAPAEQERRRNLK